MNKVIIVTGASDGLGLTIAKTLAKDHTVIATSRSDKITQAVSGSTCDSFVCDITQEDDIQKTVAYVIEKYGRIDCLINCAGVYIKGQVDENTSTDIHKVIHTNTIGTILMTREVIPHMKVQKSGLIINIVSKDGLYSKPDRSVYAASKWAITGFTKCLARDLAPYNIRATGIYPGRIKTNLQMKYDNEVIVDENRLNSDEVATTIAFIVSQPESVFYPMVSIKHVQD